ncbi:MAG TPA: hypothetical protein VIV40_19640 [Kofleriaceae bacterium]
MKTILFVAAIALLGCKKKDNEGAAGSGPTCADAVAKAVGAMPGGGTGEVQSQLKSIMTTRCTEDAWPPAVIKCYATEVTDMASMKKCRESLPADKQQRLMTEIRGVMMGAAGGAGPMHGGGEPAPAPAPAAEGSAAPPAGSAEPPK